ncbi:TetR/AcrR family transcriptional regulator [Nocardia sp. NBC_00565]|uniref:TetR/AcrR family transcriptional regulator n=1 Tax=Nocardia sp. NBC_00565 TaxID=2975993 RepID=UPI002E820166|nr:helix-turn-helix domain-containing protein [Nocardia sp. NBC_00565]WUC07528.1 TetR/AcrR family transcriptional regulator [Nocardia sp. NBC_00565]
MNATQRRISAAAMKLFAERGNTDLTISELAAEAGIARGTLYRNVDSMDELFDQVRTQLAVDVHAANVRAMNAHGHLDPPLRLAVGTRMLVRLAHEIPAMGRFIVRYGLTDESLREVMSGPPMHDVAAGIEAGRYNVTPGMELGIASMLMGTLISAMWMVLEGHQAWREAGCAAAELALCALGVPRDEARDIATRPLPAISFDF